MRDRQAVRWTDMQRQRREKRKEREREIRERERERMERVEGDRGGDRVKRREEPEWREGRELSKSTADRS